MSRKKVKYSLSNWDLVSVNPSYKVWTWKDLFSFWAVNIQSVIAFSLIASLYIVYNLNTFVVFFGTLIGSLLVYFLAELLTGLFSTDLNVIEFGKLYLQISAFVLPAYPVFFLSNGFFMALKKSEKALIANVFRNVIFPFLVFYTAVFYNSNFENFFWLIGFLIIGTIVGLYELYKQINR